MPQATEQDVNAVEAVRRVHDEAFRRGDAQGVASVFHENAVYCHPKHPEWIRGRVAIKNEWERFFNEWRVVKAQHTKAIIIVYTDSTCAIDVGWGDALFRTTGGVEFESHTRYAAYLAKQPDGNWQVIALHVASQED